MEESSKGTSVVEWEHSGIPLPAAALLSDSQDPAVICSLPQVRGNDDLMRRDLTCKTFVAVSEKKKPIVLGHP